MALGYQPDDALLVQQAQSMGIAPAAPGQDAAREREVLAQNTGPLIPLPGGGALGDLPPGVGTRALTFQAPTQPPPVDQMGAPIPPQVPLPPAPPSARPAGATTRPAAPNAQQQAINAEGTAAEAQAQAQEKAGAAAQSTSDAEAAGKLQSAATRDAQIGDVAKAQALAVQAHQKAQQSADDAIDEYKNFKFQDYWSGRDTATQRALHTTGGKIVAILGSFMGGWSQANGGGPDAVGALINREVDRNFEQQKLKLQSKEQIAQWRRQGVKDVDEYQEQQLARLKIKQGMAMDSVADRAAALAATATGKQKAAESGVLAQGFRLQGAKLKEEGQKDLVESALKRSQMGVAAADVGLKKAETAKAYAEAGAANAKAKNAGRDNAIFDGAGNVIAPGPDKEVSAKINEELSSVRGVKSAIQQLQASFSKGVAAPGSEEFRRRQSLAREITMHLPGTEGFKRMTEADIQMYNGMAAGDKDALMGNHAGVTGSLSALDQNMNGSAARALGRAGVPVNGDNVRRALSGPPSDAVPGVQQAPAAVPTAEGSVVKQNNVTFIRRGGQWVPQ